MASAMDTETEEQDCHGSERRVENFNQFSAPDFNIDRSGGRAVVEVAGETLRDSDVAGWTLRGGRSSAAERRQRREIPPTSRVSPGNDGTGERNSLTTDVGAPSKAASKRESRGAQARFARRVTARITKAARMPKNIPRNEHKIIVRPRGGLNTGRVEATALMAAIGLANGVTREEAMEDTVCANVAQNIIVVSTPCEQRAARYAQLRGLKIGEQYYEASAYLAAPSGTVKGVIYHVAASESPEDIRSNVVNRNNPTALDAHRMGDTHAVIVLFEGHKVPATIKYGSVIVRCSLYRQHHQVCRRCGKVGHRQDVCPYPQTRVCFGCGKPNPGEGHEESCKPRCKLCGGPHPTGAPGCGNRYKMPYQVKRRRWERSQKDDEGDFPPLGGSGQGQGRGCRSRSRRRSQSRRSGSARSPSQNATSRGGNSRSRDRTRSKSKGRKTSRSHERIKWSDVVVNNRGSKQDRNRSRSKSAHRLQRGKAMTAQDEEIAKLREENRRLNQRLDELLRRLDGQQAQKPTKQQPHQQQQRQEPPQKTEWEQGLVQRPQSLTPKHQRQNSPQKEDAESVSEPSTSSRFDVKGTGKRGPPSPTQTESNMEEEGEDEDDEDAASVTTVDTETRKCGVSCAVRFRRHEQRIERLEERLKAFEHRVNARFDRLEQFLFRKLGGDGEFLNICKPDAAQGQIWPGPQKQGHQ